MIEKAIQHVEKTHEKIAEKEEDKAIREEAGNTVDRAKARQDKKEQAKEVAAESKAAAKKVEKQAAAFKEASGQ